MKFVLALMAVLFASGCDSPPPPNSAETAQPPIVWSNVGKWAGHGSIQTTTFTSDSRSMRLRWEARNETADGAGQLKVTLHSADSGRLLFELLDVKGVGRDVVYMSEDPRVFFLDVVSANLDWSLEVDEGFYKPRVDDFPTSGQ